MRPIPVGESAALDIVVAPEMTVRFDELGPVHPVYATYSMAKHFEEAGRKLLLRYLEPGEAGIGSSVSVEHVAPSWIGDAVRVTARCAEVIGNKLICDVRAVDERGRELGRGTTAQAVLVQEVLHARIGEQARKPVRPVDADDRSGRVPTSEASSTISTAHSPERTEGEGPAVTVSYFALYRTPADPADFEKHYFGSHVPLIEKTPGLLENRVHRVTRQFVGDPGYYLLAELVFESQEAMKQAFRSPEWAAAGENLSAWGGIDLVTMFTAQPHQPVDAPSGD